MACAQRLKKSYLLNSTLVFKPTTRPKYQYSKVEYLLGYSTKTVENRSSLEPRPYFSPSNSLNSLERYLRSVFLSKSSSYLLSQLPPYLVSYLYSWYFGAVLYDVPITSSLPPSCLQHMSPMRFCRTDFSCRSCSFWRCEVFCPSSKACRLDRKSVV